MRVCALIFAAGLLSLAQGGPLKALVDADAPGNILNFGAKADKEEPFFEQQNCQAFMDACNAANNGTFGDDRRVVIPAG